MVLVGAIPTLSSSLLHHGLQQRLLGEATELLLHEITDNPAARSTSIPSAPGSVHLTLHRHNTDTCDSSLDRLPWWRRLPLPFAWCVVLASGSSRPRASRSSCGSVLGSPVARPSARRLGWSPTAASPRAGPRAFGSKSAARRAAPRSPSSLQASSGGEGDLHRPQECERRRLTRRARPKSFLRRPPRARKRPSEPSCCRFQAASKATMCTLARCTRTHGTPTFYFESAEAWRQAAVALDLDPPPCSAP